MRNVFSPASVGTFERQSVTGKQSLDNCRKADRGRLLGGEAIAAISDGQITMVDEVEIREAISALIALSRIIQQRRADAAPKADGVVRIEVNAPRISLEQGQPGLKLH